MGHKDLNLHLEFFSPRRHLHRPAGRPLPGFWLADGAAGRARAGRAVRVQPQRPEAAERRRRKRRFGPGEALLRGLGVLQPDPAPEEGGPRGGGEDPGPAGHDRIQGDPLHLQRHLPLPATGQEIAGAPPGGDKDWFVPRLLDSKKEKGGNSSFRSFAVTQLPLRHREHAKIFSYSRYYNVSIYTSTQGTDIVSNIF